MNDMDMTIDTDTFDFFDLVDVNEVPADDAKDLFYKSEKRPVTSSENVNLYGKQTEFEEESDDPQLFEKEEFREIDPNDDISDISRLSDEQNKEIEQAFYDLPEDAVISLGDRVITKADTIALADMREELMQEKAFFDVASRTDYEELYNHISDQAQAFKTETQLTIEALENAINNPATPKEDRIELFDRLQNERIKMDKIAQKLQQTVAARQQQEDALLRYRIHNNHVGMKQLYGKEWEKNSKAVFEYALKNGIQEKMIESYLDPALSQLFLKAKAWDSFQEKQGQKVKQDIKGYWSRSSSSAHSTDKTDKSNTQLRALQYKRRNGGLTEEDNRALFNHLID